MKKSNSVSEWDNPINVPSILIKKPGVGIREYPTNPKGKSIEDEEVNTASNGKGKSSNKFGRSKSKKTRSAVLLIKARKGD